MTRRSSATLCLILLAALSAVAQTLGTGAISGTVFDPWRRVIAGASVTAVDQATQATRAVKSGAEGDSRVPLLAPGDYVVTVVANGFPTGTISPVHFAAGEVRSLEAILGVENATTVVNVSANQQILDLESSTLGSLVARHAIDSLPLANRNFTQILGPSPGVVVDLPNAAQPGSGKQNVASDRATPTANNIQFNGLDADNLVENSAATTTQFGNPNTTVGYGDPHPAQRRGQSILRVHHQHRYCPGCTVCNAIHVFERER